MHPLSRVTVLPVQVLAFYAELFPGDPRCAARSLKTTLRDAPMVDADRVAQYLMNGVRVVDADHGTDDVITGRIRKPASRFLLGGPTLVTDGAWVWRRDLVYYVTNYHVALDESFVARAREHDFTVPEVPDSRLAAIEAWVEREHVRPR